MEERVKSDFNERFVFATIELCNKSKAIAAKLRRADNPNTEYQSWEFLGSFGVDLDTDYKRLPFTTIAAAIAKAKIEENGTLRLGDAIVRSYENGKDGKNGKDSEQAQAKLRRLLACSETPELCRVLRTLLALVSSRGFGNLDYIRLLRQIREFHFDSKKIQSQWAQEFYHSIDNQGQLSGETQL